MRKSKLCRTMFFYLILKRSQVKQGQVDTGHRKTWEFQTLGFEETERVLRTE